MPRLVVTSLLAACAFGADGVPQTNEAAPAAPAAVTAVAPAPVSDKVAEALKRFGVRARIATNGGTAAPTEAAKADLRVRLLAVDELVEADGDAAAILVAGKAAGIVPAGITDYASAMALLRAGQAKVEPVVAAKAPEPKATEAKAAEPAAPAAKLVAGVRCRLFALPPGDNWPPKGLPAIPVATLSLPALVDVDPKMVNRPAPLGEVPNRLMEHVALDQSRYYAVEYSGFLHAGADGVYGLTVESDDPYVLYLEGSEIAKSDWYIKQDEWVAAWPVGDTWFTPKEMRTNRVVAATPSLSKGRAYAFKLVAFQAWKATALRSDNGKWRADAIESVKVLSPVVTGATLRVRVIAPDGEPAAIRLYMPEAVRARREE